jgi:hypothetical protein
MKVIIPYLVCALIFNSGCAHEQKKSSSSELPENMLFEFYSKHFQIWENASDTISSNQLYSRLDSLMHKYCTVKFRNYAKQAFENVGADIPTNNLGSVDLNENLKIEKDVAKKNSYIVSFTATYSDAPGGVIKKRIVLHVKLIEEKDGYKIDEVI